MTNSLSAHAPAPEKPVRRSAARRLDKQVLWAGLALLFVIAAYLNAVSIVPSPRPVGSMALWSPVPFVMFLGPLIISRALESRRASPQFSMRAYLITQGCLVLAFALVVFGLAYAAWPVK